ncbi:MAG: hypothetical protein KFF50_07360 [Desulfatitalea sp.]|nr:hypothetical protein [Desulfatitalea sp.]
MAILAASAIRKGMVANVRISSGSRGHADPMVRKGWPDQVDQQVFLVNPLSRPLMLPLMHLNTDRTGIKFVVPAIGYTLPTE